MAYIQSRKVVLSETDATGYLYFINILKYAEEAFEDFLYCHSTTLKEAILKHGVYLPIVHTSGDLMRPIEAGDRIEVHLRLLKIGTTSLTLGSTITKGVEVIGRTEIVHVVLNKETLQKQKVPASLKELLETHLSRGS